jgi:hypothetical protein
MRTIAITVAIVAVALVILGLVIEALGWLIVIGLVVLLVAVLAGWIGVRRAGSIRRDRRRGSQRR